MTISLSDLLILGQGKDLASERGVSCSGALPEASDPQLVERAKIARAALGDRALILGHHYQRDEVIAFADITGDSFKLAQAAAQQSDAEFIFFCGVHFMAESADILTSAKQRVILPDLPLVVQWQIWQLQIRSMNAGANWKNLVLHPVQPQLHI